MSEPKDIAEAINAGIAEATPQAPAAPAAAAPASDGGGDGQPDGSAAPSPDSGGDQDGGGGDPPAATDGGDGSDATPAAAADGETPAADAGAEGKDGEGEPVADADAAAKKADDAAAAAAAAAKKPPDHLNDPIPNALKPATKERIKSLIDTAKHEKTRADTLQQTVATLVTQVRETGATPEQYGQALTYLQMVNSGDPAQIRKALEFIEGERVALARMVGVPIPGVSMIGDYPDLVAEVQAGKITQERAEEMAAQRAAQETAAAMRQHSQNTAAQRAAQQAEIRKGQNDLDAVEAELSKDPLYAVKKPILVKLLRPLFKTLPPSQWGAEFRRAYNDLPAPVRSGPAPASAGQPKGAPAPGAGNQPLRASQPAGGAVPQPKTMLEAIDFGIGSAGR